MDVAFVDPRTNKSSDMRPAFVFVGRDVTVLEALLRYRKEVSDCPLVDMSPVAA